MKGVTDQHNCANVEEVVVEDEVEQEEEEKDDRLVGQSEPDKAKYQQISMQSHPYLPDLLVGFSHHTPVDFCHQDREESPIQCARKISLRQREWDVYGGDHKLESQVDQEEVDESLECTCAPFFVVREENEVDWHCEKDVGPQRLGDQRAQHQAPDLVLVNSLLRFVDHE